MMFVFVSLSENFVLSFLIFSNCADDKVTELEAEKRAWENSPEAEARREALNPWRHLDNPAKKSS